MKTIHHLQKGFSAILAVILLVLFALIGAYMSTQLSVGSMSTSLTFNGMQAWFAARSGIEWGLYELLKKGTSCTPNMGGGLNIDGYTVTVDCSASPQITEGSDKYYVYSFSSSAVRGSSGSITHVSRKLSVYITDAP